MAEVVNLSSRQSSPESGPSDELKKDLYDCLNNVQSDGSFALFEHLNNPPNPGLYLKSDGLIGLPLSDRDAKIIIAASHAAPFGKGEQTIVDSTVRKTWELSPSEFETRNPAWQAFLKSIVAKVSIGLGVNSSGRGVSAQLYKMLLYDKGAMFKPHQDSEKAPGMFATLVIVLPSKHEGGEVRVTHSKMTKVFETSKFSEFDSSYLAWFADVTHEVRPVLAGHRLVLTYNLIHTTLDYKKLSTKSSISMSKLHLLLSEWMNNLETGIDLPTKLAFLLDHQYTKASLCFDGLKGHDRQVAAHLREACQEYGFYIYLANIERTVAGECEEQEWGGFHQITEFDRNDTILERVVELNGTEVDKKLDFDDEYFIQADPFEDEEPDDEDYSGFTGNEGVSATHIYHRTVALILPKTHRMEFFLTEESIYRSSKEPEIPKVIQWIDRLSARLADDSTDDAAREDLDQICKMVIRKSKEWLVCSGYGHRPFSDNVIVRVAQLSVELNSKTMFLDAFDLFSRKMDTSAFKSVGVAVLSFGLEVEVLLPKLCDIVSDVNILSARLEILDRIRAGIEEESQQNSQNKTTYQKWIKTQFDLALSPDVAMEREKDGISLVKMSREFSSQEIFTKILPAVKQNIHNTAMVMAFLTGLYQPSPGGEIPANVARTIFHDLISDLVDSFSLSSVSNEGAESNKRPIVPRYMEFLYDATPNTILHLQNSHIVAGLLCQCQKLELGTALSQIVNILILDAKAASLDLFESLYLPFLKHLGTLLAQVNLLVKDSPFQLLFQQILSQYIVRWVQPQPQPPKDWKQATVPIICGGCEDCRSLNRFLASPTEKVDRFPFNKGHLLRMLVKTTCTHETERSGSAQTLVVTKQANHQAEYKSWASRCDVAKKHLAEFDMATMRDLLGEMYEHIMSLSAIQLSSAVETDQGSVQTSALTSNDNASNRLLSPVTKRKTPSDVFVIDD